jgi:hypothetical protein
MKGVLEGNCPNVVITRAWAHKRPSLSSKKK